MSEFGGLWKHKNYQHALVLPKTECGCPSVGGIKNSHTPPMEERRKTNKPKNGDPLMRVLFCQLEL